MSDDLSDESQEVAADAPGRLRAAVLLGLAALVVVWVFSQGLAAWGRLPDRIPTHFGFSGRPDGWAGKSIFSVFGPLMLSAALLLVLGFVSRLGPKWYNLPGKERMLALPPPQQEYVMAPAHEALAWTAAGATIALALMTRQGWAVALGEREALSPAVGVALVAFAIIPTILGILYARGRIRALEEST